MSSITSVNDWCKYIGYWARGKGFWDHGIEREVVVEKVLLCMTELSEAYECLRDDPDPLKWNEQELKANPTFKPEGFPVELADTVIRLFDLCGTLGINLNYFISIKMQYNENRPYKHGRHPSST